MNLKNILYIGLVFCGCKNERIYDTIKDSDTIAASMFDAATDSGSNQTHKKWEVHFSPKGGCTDAIVGLIQSAKTEVLVQAYSFTSVPVIQALQNKASPDAGKPVRVRVILDRSIDGQPVITALQSKKIDVWIDAKHAIAHNKVIVVDRKVVFTGSFNFTQQAETSNAENCLIVHDSDLSAQYADNWDLHLSHSKTTSVVDSGSPNSYKEP